MALGFSASIPTNHLPILKYYPREGRFRRLDSTDHGLAARDVTENFAAIVDMETIRAGWMLFSRGSRPDLRLFPLGEPWPEAPSPVYRRGVRVIMQLAEAHGGDTCELCSTAHQFLAAFDGLHDDYLTGRLDNPGKLPVVVLARSEPGLQPEFTIAGWVERPQTLAA